MLMEQILTIPADHQLHLAIPPEFPAGKPATVVVFVPEAENSPGESPGVSPRIGFMKGRISVPEDFDTMGQEAIRALFEGKP